MNNILDYERLVYDIIKRYTNYYDKEDLYQAGMLGLAKAYTKYNNDFDTKFSTFAYFYIKGEVCTYIRENNGIKINKELLKLNKSLEKAKEVLSQRLQRIPTDKELSCFLEIDERLIEEAKAISIPVESLDNTQEESSNNLYNYIKTEDKNLNSDIIDLKVELDKLSSEEKSIIYDRYYKDLTQSEISNNLGINQVQVSRKEKKILQKLKTRL